MKLMNLSVFRYVSTEIIDGKVAVPASTRTLLRQIDGYSQEAKNN
jgi:hypothetical protein